MTTGDRPALTPDAYVVGFGGRRLLTSLASASALPALMVVYLLGSGPGPISVGLLLLTSLAGAGLIVDAVRAVRRGAVLFAIDRRGIYLGRSRRLHGPEWIAWPRVRAVEMFREKRPALRGSTNYRCLAVRVPVGSRPPGYDVVYGGVLPPKSLQLLRMYGLEPGRDGTIRGAYCRLEGARVDRAALQAAVTRFAPGVPVIAGPNWPDEIPWTRAGLFPPG